MNNSIKVGCLSMMMGMMISVAMAYVPPPIEFSTTAENDRGAMYLGNGEVGALAWVSKDGTLHTTLQRSDNWNEAGQHGKVGGLDYVTGRPVDADTFHQVLSLEKGQFEATWKSGGKTVGVHYRLQQGVDFAVCEVVGGKEPQAKMVNWHIYPKGFRTVSTAELDNRFTEWPSPAKEVTAFDIASDVVVSNGWCHLNSTKTVETLLKWYDYWQASAEFGPRDFLRDRAYGCLTKREADGERTLFISAITCWHPCPSVAEWTRRTQQLLDAKSWTMTMESAQRAAHHQSWREFWSRSHIEITPRAGATMGCSRTIANNPKLPITIGQASTDEYPWLGALNDVEVIIDGKTRYQAAAPRIGVHVDSFKPADLAHGFTFRCRFTFTHPEKSQRLFDNVTPSGSDGPLIDVHERKLRVLLAGQWKQCTEPVQVGREEKVEVVVSRAGGIKVTRNGQSEVIVPDATLAEECRAVSAAWANQRYVTGCAGRGVLPIRFNGSLFTATHNGNPDFRLWGSGYWWQNTRLPYYPMFAAGDLEMTEPLFKMYLDNQLEFNRRRTRKYLNHGGAFAPECVMPWGDQFAGCYGTGRKWADRKDKLQDSPCHKYAWVCQLELSFMLLERYAFTQDAEWFKAKALPSIREYVTYFDQHYPRNAEGKYVFWPAQAIESYQNCTNAMTEVSGLHAVVARLLELPEGLLSKEDRANFARIQAALPPLPTRKLANGELVYAPADQYRPKPTNYELPELYCVYPFRLCSFEKPNAEQGRRTYAARIFRLFHGWSHDELFAATLGMAEEARTHFVDRVLTHSNRAYRWPACWGPNFNWCPDIDEGSNIQNIPQQMLMQYEGKKIFLLPAWPKDWNCRFRLHAPYQTTVEGRVENGRIKDLVVTPASRRQDVVVCGS